MNRTLPNKANKVNRSLPTELCEQNPQKKQMSGIFAADRMSPQAPLKELCTEAIPHLCREMGSKCDEKYDVRRRRFTKTRTTIQVIAARNPHIPRFGGGGFRVAPAAAVSLDALMNPTHI